MTKPVFSLTDIGYGYFAPTVTIQGGDGIEIWQYNTAIYTRDAAFEKLNSFKQASAFWFDGWHKVTH